MAALSVTESTQQEPELDTETNDSAAGCPHASAERDLRTWESYCIGCGTVLDGPPLTYEGNGDAAGWRPTAGTQKMPGFLLRLDNRERIRQDEASGKILKEKLGRLAARLTLPDAVEREVVRVALAARDAGTGGSYAAEVQVAAAALLVMRWTPRFAPIAKIQRVADALGADTLSTRRLMYREIRYGTDKLGLGKCHPPGLQSLHAYSMAEPEGRDAVRGLLAPEERGQLDSWVRDPRLTEALEGAGRVIKPGAVMAALAIEASGGTAGGRARLSYRVAARAFGVSAKTILKAKAEIAGWRGR